MRTYAKMIVAQVEFVGFVCTNAPFSQQRNTNALHISKKTPGKVSFYFDILWCSSRAEKRPLFILCLFFALNRRERALTETNVLWRDLHQFVVFDILKGFLEREHDWRSELDRFIGTR